jgi:hypothetical protein
MMDNTKTKGENRSIKNKKYLAMQTVRCDQRRTFLVYYLEWEW